MTLRVSIFAGVAAFLLMLVVLELIRSRRLRERYALLWLLTSAVILSLAVWRGALEKLASTVGIYYAPSALFVLASLFILVVLLHYSTVISKLSDQNAILAQRLALLEQEVGEVKADRRDGVRAGPSRVRPSGALEAAVDKRAEGSTKRTKGAKTNGAPRLEVLK